MKFIKEKPFFEGLIEFMTSGPVVVMILSMKMLSMNSEN